MEIKRIGWQPSEKGSADWFTGTVRIDPLQEPVRVMAGIAMGLKCPVCAAEDRADSEYESARSDNKADGAFQAHPAGRRAFWPPSAAPLPGVPSI